MRTIGGGCLRHGEEKAMPQMRVANLLCPSVASTSKRLLSVKAQKMKIPSVTKGPRSRILSLFLNQLSVNESRFFSVKLTQEFPMQY